MHPLSNNMYDGRVAAQTANSVLERLYHTAQQATSERRHPH